MSEVTAGAAASRAPPGADDVVDWGEAEGAPGVVQRAYPVLLERGHPDAGAAVGTEFGEQLSGGRRGRRGGAASGCALIGSSWRVVSPP
ncbi:MAG: hypothetical protein HOY79_10385 [Streptomyces sp.]|nr:hypothetical protein [Streptomyces sp.]